MQDDCSGQRRNSCASFRDGHRVYDLLPSLKPSAAQWATRPQLLETGLLLAGTLLPARPGREGDESHEPEDSYEAGYAIQLGARDSWAD